MIRKTSETRPLTGTIVNAYNDSQVNAYSTEYVNKLEEWTQLTASGSTSITLPENYKEIRVIVINNAYQNWYIGTFTKDFLVTVGDKYYRIGHYTTSNDNSSCTIRIKSDLVALADAYINGSNRTATSTVYVYYR